MTLLLILVLAVQIYISRYLYRICRASLMMDLGMVVVAFWLFTSFVICQDFICTLLAGIVIVQLFQIIIQRLSKHQYQELL